MAEKETFRVAFLPGGITPAEIQYRRLLEALGGRVEPLVKDLELYKEETPPAGYRLSMEVEGLRREADSAGWGRFHLFGYSGGGSAALAFIMTYPERVKSLALVEPPAIPTREWIQSEAEYWQHMQWMMTLPPGQQMEEFRRVNVAPGVELPPPPAGDPPPWMSRRPAGIKALSSAFVNAEYTNDQLRRFDRPVYLAIGSRSNAIEERKAAVLENLFPDFRCEIFECLHHFDPPQRAQPERFAEVLVRFWEKANQ